MYQEQILKLIEEYGELEFQRGYIRARIEHAMTLIGAIEDAVPKQPRLVVSENAPYGSIQDAVFEVVNRGDIEFFDIANALRSVGIDSKTDTLRATIAKLVQKGKIRRVTRGTYGPIQVEKTA